MTIEKTIESAKEMLNRADGVPRSVQVVGKQLGAMIIACGYLIEIIEGQQRRIEQLEDVLQNHLETEPRRR